MADALGILDYIVIVVTLGVSLMIGFYYAFIAKQASGDDLLVGGRNIGVLPLTCSMLVTYLSAVQVMGIPAEVYGFGTQLYMSTLVCAAFIPISIYFFMPVFFKLQLTSVYEYLELRYQSVLVRKCASVLFVLQMTFFMSVCLYGPSVALKTVFDLELWTSVLGMGISATIYTSIGGMRAVVWTDVFQMCMMLAGLFSIIIHGMLSAGGFGETFRKAEEHGRLELFNFSVDPFMRYNTLNFILGSGFTFFATFGTHQPIVQRYCSAPNLRKAVWAGGIVVPLKIFSAGLCVLAGVAIFASYAGCDPGLLKQIERIDQIVPHFVIDRFAEWPGMKGLFVSCVFSASLSSLSSGLNSIAAVVWQDFVSQAVNGGSLAPERQASYIRLIAIGFGGISIGLAFVVSQMGGILSALMAVLGTFDGPLGAIFIMGVLCPFINKNGALVGMIVASSTMIWITIGSFTVAKHVIQVPLPFSVDQCDNTTVVPSNINMGMDGVDYLDGPAKIYTLSFIMYSFVGGMITIIVGAIVSFFTGGNKDKSRIPNKFLHPWVQDKTQGANCSNELKDFDKARSA